MDGQGAKRFRFAAGIVLLFAVSAVTSGSTTTLQWTSGTTVSGGGGPLTINDLIYGGGRYVAVGAGIMESTDGVTWNTVYTAAPGTGLDVVAYGNGLYVASSAIGTPLLLTSPDGVNWTPVSKPPRIAGDIVFGNGMFVAIGDEIVASKDGVTWSSHPSALVGTAPVGFTAPGLGFNGSDFIIIVVADGVAIVYSSPDGSNWSASQTFAAPLGTAFNRIRTLSKGFAALGLFSIDSGPCTSDPSQCDPNADPELQVVATSADGITWSSATIETGDLEQTEFEDIASNGSEYFATTFSGELVISSDSVHWCRAAGLPQGARANSLAINGKQLVIADLQGDILSTNLGSSGASYACSDALSGPSTASGGSDGTGGKSGSGGGGDFGLLLLTGLLGLSVVRRKSDLDSTRVGRP